MTRTRSDAKTVHDRMSRRRAESDTAFCPAVTRPSEPGPGPVAGPGPECARSGPPGAGQAPRGAPREPGVQSIRVTASPGCAVAGANMSQHVNANKSPYNNKDETRSNCCRVGSQQPSWRGADRPGQMIKGLSRQCAGEIG